MGIGEFIGDQLSLLNTALCTVGLLKHGRSHRYPTEVFVKSERGRFNVEEFEVVQGMLCGFMDSKWTEASRVSRLSYR